MGTTVSFAIIAAFSALLYGCAHLVFDFTFRPIALLGCAIGGPVLVQVLRSAKLHVID